jgi:hypothetical protein
MANAPDSLVVTGPVFQQLAADVMLVTPTHLPQATLADALSFANLGTVDPHVVGAPWWSANGLTRSAG